MSPLLTLSLMVLPLLPSPTEVPAQEVALAPAQTGELWGYIDPTGRVVIEPAYARAEFFAEGLAEVALDERRIIIDRAGREVFELPEAKTVLGFSEGLAAVETVNGFGYVDTSGGWAIEPGFRFGLSFSSGLAAAALPNGPWGFIDKTGRFVIEPKYASVMGFSEGLALVHDGRQWGYVDPTGKTVFMSKHGCNRIRMVVGDCTFSEGLVWLQSGKSWVLFDKAGRSVLEAPFKNVSAFAGGRAYVRDEDGWGYIDPTGRFISAQRYDDVAPFSEGLARVRTAGKHGFIDRTGRMVIEPAFEYAGSFRRPSKTKVILF